MAGGRVPRLAMPLAFNKMQHADKPLLKNIPSYYRDSCALRERPPSIVTNDENWQ